MIGLVMIIPITDPIISHHLFIIAARHSICEDVYLNA